MCVRKHQELVLWYFHYLGQGFHLISILESISLNIKGKWSLLNHTIIFMDFMLYLIYYVLEISWLGITFLRISSPLLLSFSLLMMEITSIAREPWGEILLLSSPLLSSRDVSLLSLSFSPFYHVLSLMCFSHSLLSSRASVCKRIVEEEILPSSSLSLALLLFFLPLKFSSLSSQSLLCNSPFIRDLFTMENSVAKRSESKVRHGTSPILLLLSPPVCAPMGEEENLSFPSSLPCTRACARIRGRRKFSPLLHARMCVRKGREEGGKFSSPLPRSCIKGRRRVFISFTSPHALTRMRGRNCSPSLFLSHLPSFSIFPSLSLITVSSESSALAHVWPLLAIAREKREKGERSR